jgi:lipid-binding SYLF domain-containing protein
MQTISRRTFLTGAAATPLLAACGNGIGSGGGDDLDRRADAALADLYSRYPGTADLRDRSVGQLVMPLVTQAGAFLAGGAYGRGVLRVGGVSVDYYSAARAGFGPQLGAQQYSHVLFFMTPEALAEFRTSQGYTAGAGLTYVAGTEGETFRADTDTVLNPVIAVVFGQAGLIVGATLEGTKYTRIIP